MSELEDVRQARQGKKKSRGMTRNMVTTPPVWGTIYPPDPVVWQGKVTLMEKQAGRGGIDEQGLSCIEYYMLQRYFLNKDVAAAETRTWKVVEFIDPTKPAVQEMLDDRNKQRRENETEEELKKPPLAGKKLKRG